MTGTVLVTGAAGFIGSHVAETLASKGVRVVGFDNLDPYYDPSLKLENTASVERSSPKGYFDFVQGDLRDRDELATLVKARSVTRIVHLGGLAGVRASIDRPRDYVDVNITGSQNLLDAARANGVKTFVFASTSSAYGETTSIPFVERDAADRPLSPYAASKRAVEILGYSYHHAYRLNFTALRLFTVYGPRNRPDMMAAKVLDSIYTGREIPLYNGGQMFRDWTYVEDIVRGIVTALERPLGYQLINLGCGKPVRLLDFVRRLEGLAGRRANLLRRPMPTADVPRTWADLSKARQLLDYRPEIGVERGAAALFRWYKQHRRPVEVAASISA